MKKLEVNDLTDGKIITVRQPWAHFIIRPDLKTPMERLKAEMLGNFKDCENRNWKTKYKGRLYIHAAKKPDPLLNDIKTEFSALGLYIPDNMTYQSIIGYVTMTDCVKNDNSFWFTGPYAFKLKDPTPIEPIRLKGKLSLWAV